MVEDKCCTKPLVLAFNRVPMHCCITTLCRHFILSAKDRDPNAKPWRMQLWTVYTACTQNAMIKKFLHSWSPRSCSRNQEGSYLERGRLRQQHINLRITEQCAMWRKESEPYWDEQNKQLEVVIWNRRESIHPFQRVRKHALQTEEGKCLPMCFKPDWT